MKHLLITICCMLAYASAANASDIPGVPGLPGLPGLGDGSEAPFEQKNTYDAKEDPNVYYGAGGGALNILPDGSNIPAAPTGGGTTNGNSSTGNGH